MKLKTQRLTGLILLAIFIFLTIKLQPFLKNIFEVVNQDYSYDRPIKSIMLGVLCLSFVAAVKLLMRK